MAPIRYLLPIDTRPAFCPNYFLRRGAEVESRLRRAKGLSLLKIRAGAGCGHNVPRQGLEFSNALLRSWRISEIVRGSNLGADAVKG